MPIYKYITIEPDGSDGDVFEVEQSAGSDPIKKHPENGKPSRGYSKPRTSISSIRRGREKSLGDTARIKKAGFKILQKDKLTGNYHAL